MIIESMIHVTNRHTIASKEDISHAKSLKYSSPAHKAGVSYLVLYIFFCFIIFVIRTDVIKISLRMKIILFGY